MIDSWKETNGGKKRQKEAQESDKKMLDMKMLETKMLETKVLDERRLWTNGGSEHEIVFQMWP